MKSLTLGQLKACIEAWMESDNAKILVLLGQALIELENRQNRIMLHRLTKH